jgi:hypothetical protein
MFPLGQILTCAVGGLVVSAVALLVYRRLGYARDPRWDASVVALPLVVGLSILAWRAAGNTAALNDDPIAFVSPNDVLCPVITYVTLGIYSGSTGGGGGADWPRLRALLTVVSLVVNVVTI